MGGRGTYSAGQSPKYTYETVGKIGDVKVLAPIEKTKALKLPEIDKKRSRRLPEESHSERAYIKLDDKGEFRQYREYNEKHELVLEIGYHHERVLGKGDVLHIHVHGKPGIDNHNNPSTVKRKLTRTEYQKYKKLFKGVKIDEGKYFS